MSPETAADMPLAAQLLEGALRKRIAKLEALIRELTYRDGDEVHVQYYPGTNLVGPLPLLKKIHGIKD